jgi:hypothetical protein
MQMFDTHPPIEKRIAVLERLGGHAPTAIAAVPATDAPASSAPHQHGPWG